jgi:hypothetical protein
MRQTQIAAPPETNCDAWDSDEKFKEVFALHGSRLIRAKQVDHDPGSEVEQYNAPSYCYISSPPLGTTECRSGSKAEETQSCTYEDGENKR